MNIELTALETRVLGCLIEKEITTPEAYPLSLNALTNACTQKSNRDPALDLGEIEVQTVVDGLVRKFHVAEQGGYGSRVPKYRHRFCNTEYGTLKFSAQELAIVCELFLRGAQTPGELRSRASRMAPFADAAQVEAALEGLAAREDGPFVVRLAREPGKRECRYAHLFSGEPPHVAAETRRATEAPGAVGGDADRLADLEARITALEAVLAEILERLPVAPTRAD